MEHANFVVGQSWAACSTEGLMVYSTHTDELFDPFDLDPTITPESTRALLSGELRDPGRALIMALRLNETLLIAEAMESVSMGESMCHEMKPPSIF